MIEPATKTRIYERFLRTNAPAPLLQAWAEVQGRLGLMAVAFVSAAGGTHAAQAESGGECWLHVAPDVPAAATAAVEAFVGRFPSACPVLVGSRAAAVCSNGRRAGTPFRMTRQAVEGTTCDGCARIFEAEGIQELLVIPRLSEEGAVSVDAMMFIAAVPLEPEEVCFLHTVAGLYFIQQALWEGGRRQEPAVALKPREIECIRWAVTGRTLAEIAGVMRLSYRTVRFHLDAARARYGFSTNQQLFVQAAKDYGLDPDGTPQAIRRQSVATAAQPMRRMQPMWEDRRGAFDRRVGDRRQNTVTPLPFADRRTATDRRSGERRAVAEPGGRSTAETVLTPEEIRALLN